MRRQTRRIITAAALAAVSAAALVPASAGPDDRFERLCDRFGGTYYPPAACDGIDLPYITTSSPTTLFAGPFRAFERAAPLEEPYDCFPGVNDEGRIEFIGCAEMP
jgi:hypothetical protein